MDNFDEQYAAAKQTTKDSVHIISVTLLDSSRKISLSLSNQVEITFPVDIVEGLSGVPMVEIRNYDATEEYLFWEELDVELYLPGLLQGAFGTKNWMKELGRRGGSSTSEAKVKAARTNGLKGGRPRKQSIKA